jgi:hypothetical protein
VTVIVALVVISKVAANGNGLALTPPLGWTSWNLYLGNVHQEELIAIMDGMVRRKREDHLGNLFSLCDLGYCDVGLDDTPQASNSPQAVPGMHYHDANENPIVNLNHFPGKPLLLDL